jgi:hypothetical protein
MDARRPVPVTVVVLMPQDVSIRPQIIDLSASSAVPDEGEDIHPRPAFMTAIAEKESGTAHASRRTLELVACAFASNINRYFHEAEQ